MLTLSVKSERKAEPHTVSYYEGSGCFTVLRHQTNMTFIKGVVTGTFPRTYTGWSGFRHLDEPICIAYEIASSPETWERDVANAKRAIVKRAQECGARV